MTANFLNVDFSEGFRIADATPEEMVLEAKRLLIDATCLTDRRKAMDSMLMADTLSTMATAIATTEMAICGHGTRGWCPYCHYSMKNGMMPNE